MVKTKCDKCGNYFSNNNYEKHNISCDGSYSKFTKSTECKHCGIGWNILNTTTTSAKANHSRWCKSNPKYYEYIDDLKKRDSLTLMYIGRKKSGKLNQFVAAKLRGDVYNNPLKGKKNPNRSKPHTLETKELLRQKALASNHRRLRKSMVLYKDVWLDSSWELELAKRLDALAIRWERPAPIKWMDKGGTQHNYFPDFYLIDYDLYLDPKNPAAFENQKEKIEIIKNIYPNVKFITTIDECKNFNV
jgi:hypothetical protein